MPRAPIPTWYFALVVVRHGSRYLLVEERKHGGGWYLPAGRVEPGEHSLGAAYYTLAEIRTLHLRDREVLSALSAIDAGAPIHPLSVLAHEGAPWI